jgi:hypothetical protein
MSKSMLQRIIHGKRGWISKLFLTNLLSVLLLAACSSDTTSYLDIIPDMMAPPTPTPDPDIARFMLIRTVRWPGGGREMTLGILNQNTGAPFSQDLSSRITARPTDGSALAMKVQKIAVQPGYTALLLPPSQTAAERSSLSQAILDFVAKRPATERIALYRHGSNVQLFSNFLKDRTKLTEALDRYQKGVDSDPDPLPLIQAASTTASDVENVGGTGSEVMRSLVVLTKDPKSVYINYTQIYALAVTPDAAGLTAASLAIDDVRKNAFYKVASCGAEIKLTGRIQVTDMQGELNASFSSTLPEEVGATCNVDLIDTAKRPYTPRLEFVFDATQRADYAARIRATQSATYDDVLARSDFVLQLRLSPGQPTILTTTHLHGNSTIRCDRKNFLIELSGPDRYLIPDSASDKYLLISMCDDPAYVYAPTAYGLLSDDLFALKFRFVELIIDGKTNGIYILMEKSETELVGDSARVTSVMRRQYPAATNDLFEVHYSNTPDLTAPATRYAQFASKIAPLSGDALIAALRDGMDLDQYLRYLAHESVLKSGDYIDEMLFYGSEQANGMGGIGETYRVNAWDPEGFSNCHSGGVNAYPDPNNIAYCAEAKLDFKILPDAKVYTLFARKTDDALATTLSREKMANALEQSKNSLLALFVNPAVCAAMTELLKLNANAADCAVARMLISARADALLTAYDTRRAYLQTQLTAYHAKYGP